MDERSRAMRSTLLSACSPSLRLSRARAALPLAAAVFSIQCLPAIAPATTRAWNAGTGSWSVASNWNPNGIPAALDTLNITETDGVSRTITYDYTGSNVTLTALTITLTNFTGTNNTTFSMPANILTVTNEYVGNSGAGSNGTGAFLQSGGNNTATASLYLGFNPSDQGYYTLSGNSTLNVTTNEYVGYGGFGNFTQAGGNVSIKGTTDLFLGYNPGSSGNYSLKAPDSSPSAAARSSVISVPATSSSPAATTPSPPSASTSAPPPPAITP